MTTKAAQHDGGGDARHQGQQDRDPDQPPQLGENDDQPPQPVDGNRQPGPQTGPPDRAPG